MTDKRRLRSLKQARRDVRRAKKRNTGGAAAKALTDVIRGAMSGEHPLGLLRLASQLIHLSKPDRLAFLKSGRRSTLPLETTLNALIGLRNREATALLTVIAELLVDDPASEIRCREELSQRRDHLPRWIAELPQIEVDRAARRTDVFGDVDELLVGIRLNGQYELTVGVVIDHNRISGITDAGVVPWPIDEALGRLTAPSTQFEIVEMASADARVWIEDALTKLPLGRETERWPLHRPLVEWLVGRLPEGGERRPAAMDWQVAEELCDTFLAGSSAAPFADWGYRDLLLKLFDTGTEDPLRWSAARVADVLDRPDYDGNFRIPLEVALDVPDLLRAFIPYAHAQSGIGDELTSRTLAVIDELRSSYKRKVLEQAQHMWGYDDVG